MNDNLKLITTLLKLTDESAVGKDKPLPIVPILIDNEGQPFRAGEFHGASLGVFEGRSAIYVRVRVGNE